MSHLRLSLGLLCVLTAALGGALHAAARGCMRGVPFARRFGTLTKVRSAAYALERHARGMTKHTPFPYTKPLLPRKALVGRGKLNVAEIAAFAEQQQDEYASDETDNLPRGHDLCSLR